MLAATNGLISMAVTYDLKPRQTVSTHNLHSSPLTCTVQVVGLKKKVVNKEFCGFEPSKGLPQFRGMVPLPITVISAETLPPHP